MNTGVAAGLGLQYDVFCNVKIVGRRERPGNGESLAVGNQVRSGLHVVLEVLTVVAGSLLRC